MRRALLLIMALLWLLAPGNAAFAMQQIRDDSGRIIRFEGPYTRIISLYAAHTENLFALGLDKEILAVSLSEDHPPQALAKPRMSYRDDPERFMALRPDLVLIRPMIFRGYPHLVKRLERSGITVVSLQPKGPQAMLEYWQKLGRLTGREAQGGAMVDKFQAGVAGFKSKLEGVPYARRPGVYFESMHKKMRTFSPGAMALFTLRTAGGRNVATDAEPARGSNIAHYGKERILAKAGQIDIYLAQLGTMNKVNLTDIKNETGFSIIKAVKEGRVHLVPEQIVSRPTLRLLQGVELINSLLYPDGR
jgi:iron complex transport system substrate-binding protein